MRTKLKSQKTSAEVSPTLSPALEKPRGHLTLGELFLEADSMLNLARKHQSEMAVRHWTLPMTEEVDADFQAFKAARTAYLTERDLRKDSTTAFKATVQTARSTREGLTASLRFIGQSEPALLADVRLAGQTKTPRSLGIWLNDAVSLATKYEQQLIACGFSTDPIGTITAQASTLGSAIATQELNQANLPALRAGQLAAREKLGSSLERLRQAGLMTFVGNKAVQKEFRKYLPRRRKAKAAMASPAETATPAPAAESAPKPATSPAPDAAKPAS